MAAAMNMQDVDTQVKLEHEGTPVLPNKDKDTYKVACWGNSAKDLVLIPLALLLVYVLTAVLFAVCTRAVLRTDSTSTALWMFFGIYVAFVAMLGVVLGVKSYEKKMIEKHAGDVNDA